MSKPPPPRYKIVERDGRLITIDTWAKGKPSPTPVPTRAQSGANRARMTPPSPGTVGTTFDAVGGVLLSILVPTTDDTGRRQLTTTPSFDKHGPRTISLSAASERKLGRVLTGVVAIVLAGVIAALLDFTLFLAVLVLFTLAVSSLATLGQGPITRFLDTLDDDLPG